MPEAIQNMTQTVWGLPVIIYLFLAGVGAGAYLTSWWNTRQGGQGTLSVVGRYLAAPLVAVGTLLLVFDLGAGRMHLGRIFGLYSHPESIMSLGTWILTIFLVLSVIDGYGPLVRVRRAKWLGALTAVMAVAVAIYTGVLLGVVKAIPLWNTALLPVLFVLSACSTGMAAAFFVALLGGRRNLSDVESFGALHIGLVLTEVVVLALLLFFAANGPSAAHYSYVLMVSGRYAAAFWYGLVVLGLALPIAYAWLSRARGLVRYLQSPGWVMLESLLVLVGGFFLRYLVVSAGAVGRILG